MTASATVHTGTPQPNEVPYAPQGAALELFHCRSPECLIEGPAGSGKSRAVLEKLNLLAEKYPGMRGLIVRKTRQSITQSVQVTFEQKVLPKGSPIRLHHEAQEYRYPNGSRLILGGLDDDTKVFSSEYDVCYANEATELTEANWEALTTRLRNGVMPYQQIIGDCNPDAPTHWLNVRCNAGKTVRLVSKHEDNPTVTPEYIATLDALTGFRYQRLRLGLWVAAEGQFFEEWDPEQHVCDPFVIPPDWTRWVGVDYGFADPFCALWLARGPDRRIVVYREVYRTGLRDEQQAILIRERSRGERIVRWVGDPSMFNKRTEQQKPSIAKVYRALGVPLVPGYNARIPGWQAVRRVLASASGNPPRLRIFRPSGELPDYGCPNLIRTLPEMVRDRLDPEDLADKIGSVKTDDHGCDALRYSLLAEQTPILPPTQRQIVFAG